MRTFVALSPGVAGRSKQGQCSESCSQVAVKLVSKTLASWVMSTAVGAAMMSLNVHMQRGWAALRCDMAGLYDLPSNERRHAQFRSASVRPERRLGRDKAGDDPLELRQTSRVLPRRGRRPNWRRPDSDDAAWACSGNLAGGATKGGNTCKSWSSDVKPTFGDWDQVHG